MLESGADARLPLRLREHLYDCARLPRAFFICQRHGGRLVHFDFGQAWDTGNPLRFVVLVEKGAHAIADTGPGLSGRIELIPVFTVAREQFAHLDARHFSVEGESDNTSAHFAIHNTDSRSRL